MTVGFKPFNVFMLLILLLGIIKDQGTAQDINAAFCFLCVSFIRCMNNLSNNQHFKHSLRKHWLISGWFSNYWCLYILVTTVYTAHFNKVQLAFN